MTSTNKKAQSNKIRGKLSKASRGGVRRRAAALDGVEARARSRGWKKRLTKDATPRAKQILADLGIPETEVSMGLARQHVQLIDMIDLAHQNAGIDGRALGAIGTASKQAAAVLGLLKNVGEDLKARRPKDVPAPAQVGATPKTPTIATVKPAAEVDEWGMPVKRSGKA